MITFLRLSPHDPVPYGEFELGCLKDKAAIMNLLLSLSTMRCPLRRRKDSVKTSQKLQIEGYMEQKMPKPRTTRSHRALKAIARPNFVRELLDVLLYFILLHTSGMWFRDQLSVN